MSAIDARQRRCNECRELLRIATVAAQDAAALIRERASAVASLEWRKKGPADFVSDVDTSAEHAIRAVLARETPDATVLGEEMSPTISVDTGVAFVVDPLDGTTNFLHGYPAY